MWLHINLTVYEWCVCVNIPIILVIHVNFDLVEALDLCLGHESNASCICIFALVEDSKSVDISVFSGVQQINNSLSDSKGLV